MQSMCCSLLLSALPLGVGAYLEAPPSHGCLSDAVCEEVRAPSAGQHENHRKLGEEQPSGEALYLGPSFLLTQEETEAGATSLLDKILPAWNPDLGVSPTVREQPVLIGFWLFKVFSWCPPHFPSQWNGYSRWDGRTLLA